MKSFEFLLPKRNTKPRNNGLTMVLDKGLGLNNAKSLMEISGEYVDLLKFGWGTSILHNKNIIMEKISMYKSFDIIPFTGGTLFEIAYLKDKIEDVFIEAKNMGFEAIEISNGSTNMSEDEKLNFVKQAKEYDFFVLSEVGKKNVAKDKEISLEQRINSIKDEINAGSDLVIMEGRESGKNIGIYDSNGELKLDLVDAIKSQVDVNKILWEAPNKNQQVDLVLNIGPNVNLGNISTEEITSVETIRRGLRGDTVGKFN
jgi:phosphosulfolactate synthase